MVRTADERMPTHRREYWDGAEKAREATDILGLRRIKAIKEALNAGKALREIAEYRDWQAGAAASLNHQTEARQ